MFNSGVSAVGWIGVSGKALGEDLSGSNTGVDGNWLRA